MTLYERYLWTRESTARTLVGLFVLASFFIAGYGITHAALSTTYDVTNEVQMNLDVSITGTQTTGIILSSPQINGINHRFATTTGGLLRIRSGNFREDITYTSATIGSDNRVTLVGVTRNICAQYARQYISCGDGRRWGKGAIVELTVDARILNLKLNLDRRNNLTGSGQITGTGTGQAIIDLPCITTTQRDAFNSADVSDGQLICNSTTGTFQQRIGGAWLSIGTTGDVNATESVAGKVELATIAEQLSKGISGSAGPLVVQTQYLTSSGAVHGINGTVNASRIPILNASGALAASMGGLGRINPSSGSLLVGAGSGAVGLLRGTTTGQIPRWDNPRGVWTATGGILVNDKTVFLSATTSTATGASNITNVFARTHEYTIPAGELVAGVAYIVESYGQFTLTNTGGADELDTFLDLGDTEYAFDPITQEAASVRHTNRYIIMGTAAAGASVPVRVFRETIGNVGTTDAHNYLEANVATNAAVIIRQKWQFDTSSASNNIQLFMTKITKSSTSPF